MAEQEQFEADFIAALPSLAMNLVQDDYGIYRGSSAWAAHKVWQQQAARHKAEIAELVNALKPFAALLQSHNESGLPSRPVFGINDATIYLHNLRSAAAAVAKYEEKQ